MTTLKLRLLKQHRRADQAGMPAETTRNYVRESRPGQTQQGSDRNLISSMLGVNPGGNPELTRNGAAPAVV